jgi:hypothetical protein
LNGFGAGDRVWARGTVEGNNVPAAKQVILMNKAEIAKKNDDERRDWVQRGIVGKVAGVNPETKDITLTIQRPPAPGAAGQPPAAPQTQNIIIPTTDSKVKIRRYTEETVKFSDAKPSKFEEVRVGDQLRALGNFNSTNTQYTPEQIVFGTFRTLTGKITAIDAAKNEITITDEEKKQAITLTLKPDSTLKRVDFGAMMMGGGFGGGMRPPGAGGPPSGGGQGAGQGAGTGGGQGQGQGQGTGGGQGQGRGPGGGGPGGPRMGGGRGFDIQALIDRMPETTLAALQVGEMIVVAGTKNQDPKRLTAITLLSNVEPLMAMMARFGGGQGGRPGGDGLGGGGFDLGGLGLP